MKFQKLRLLLSLAFIGLAFSAMSQDSTRTFTLSGSIDVYAHTALGQKSIAFGTASPTTSFARSAAATTDLASGRNTSPAADRATVLVDRSKSDTWSSSSSARTAADKVDCAAKRRADHDAAHQRRHVAVGDAEDHAVVLVEQIRSQAAVDFDADDAV